MKKILLIIKNAFKHFHLVNKHRFKVFILCMKAGIPLRGLVHDLSKYSIAEFFESVKYYNGNYSPLASSKKENGYSRAWLHHKGRNKHHYEYWYDYDTIDKTPIIPYKYVVEMICDTLASGQVYNGKNWTNGDQLAYWNKRKDKAMMNDSIKQLLSDIYTQVSKEGIDKVITKSNLKNAYQKHIGNF